MKRDTSTAYLLLAASAFGMAGLHRFYLGKPVSGLVWFMTMGLGGIGTLYDLLTLHRQVEEANQPALPAGAEAARKMLPAASSAVPFAAPLELRIMRVAKANGGRITVMQAAAEIGVHTDAVEQKLDEMCHKGQASIEVSEDGVLYYDFPDLRFR